MKIRTLFNLFIPEEESTEQNILFGFLLFTIIICFFLVGFNWFYIKLDDGPYFLIGCLNVLLVGLLKITKSKHIVGNLYLGIWAIVLVNLSFHTGAIYSMDTICMAFIPLAAIALIDHKSGLAWFIFYIAYIYYLWVTIDTPDLETYYRAQTLVFKKFYYAVGAIVLSAFTTGLFSIFYFQNRQLIAKLKAKEAALNLHVSELKEQSILLKKTEEDLKRSNLELEEFAHVTSHDLKQPLGTINSFANLLQTHLKRKEIDDKQSIEMLQFIVNGSNKMNSLITDLLDFAKLKKDEDITYHKTNLNELLESVEADLKDQIDSNGVTIEKADLPELQVIPVKINQLFQNLMSNAIKFRKQDAALVLQIGAQERSDHWEFFVKDNGIGIDKEYQKKIFMPFKKLHHSSVYSGSGIGLATCMHIIKLHEGKIWLDSILGQGSTFYFTIPKDLQIPITNPLFARRQNKTNLSQLDNK